MANSSEDFQGKFEKMQTSLSGQLPTIFALTAATQATQLATLFGVNMVFRFLKFGSRLRKVYEAEQKEFDQNVRTQGVVLMPVNIRPTSALVETFFLSGMAKRTNPKEYKSMKKIIKAYKTGDFATRTVALKQLEVAYFLIKQGGDWQDNEALLDLANVSIKRRKSITFRKMVEALEPVYGKEFIGFPDFDQLLEQYAMQDLQALKQDITKIRGQQINKLRNTVKDMFWDTMLYGDQNTTDSTLAFIVAKKLLTQQDRKQRLEEEIAQCEDDDEKGKLQKRMKKLEEEIETLNNFSTT